MALASIFGTNLFQYEPDRVIEFYDESPEVRESFAQASAWTGLSVEALLRQNGNYDDDEQRIQAVSIGLAAAQLGIQDVLSGKGLRPTVVGGLSLGGMVSSCVAGAIGRRELMSILLRGRHGVDPAGGERAEGIAAAYLALDYDPDHYYGEQREGVFLSGDFGLDAGGRIRIQLLCGYRDSLEKLAAQEPEGVINVTEGVDVAVHSPLRESARRSSREYIDTLPFTDPVLPLCSCLEQKTLTRAGEVRDMFVDNVVKPVSVVHLCEEMKRHGTQLALVVGPSPVMNALQYPFPVVFVDSPRALPQAVAAVFEHGVPLSRG
ncbi:MULTISPECIES: acyltransferase domain-containing protein [unclassified Streptomyces]|uniref:acyltransferase domain-containing protein n=1 Tax=unclassified Streptomyces TaxID=2593676 RepID=UPI0020257176|nr:MULTISPECIES: acyltransferase domain-containing protein [unclassified Streptomyces]MCX4547586.1 ACP S-malonyltransferase [Streptomyces sp. NBC_01500]